MFVKQKGVGQVKDAKCNENSWDYLCDFKEIDAYNTENN
jgi:hypothetical protein